MDGRQFLSVARLSLDDVGEEWQRTAVGRAYFALFLECRSALARWGLANIPTHQAHAFVRLRFLFPANTDLRDVGAELEELHELRTRADYEIGTPFLSPYQVEQAVVAAEEAISLLDAIDADAGRRAAAIAAIQAVR